MTNQSSFPPSSRTSGPFHDKSYCLLEPGKQTSRLPTMKGVQRPVFSWDNKEGVRGAGGQLGEAVVCKPHFPTPP